MATPKKPAKKASKKKKATKKATSKKATSKKATSKKATSKKATSKKAKKAATRRPLYQRLGIQEQDFHIVNAPEGFEIEVPAGFGLGFSLPSRLGANDAVLAFVGDLVAVRALAKGLKTAATPTPDVVGRTGRLSPGAGPLVWVAYPVSAQGEALWDALSELAPLGYEAAALVSVDKMWSAVRLRACIKD